MSPKKQQKGSNSKLVDSEEEGDDVFDICSQFLDDLSILDAQLEMTTLSHPKYNFNDEDNSPQEIKTNKNKNQSVVLSQSQSKKASTNEILQLN